MKLNNSINTDVLNALMHPVDYTQTNNVMNDAENLETMPTTIDLPGFTVEAEKTPVYKTWWFYAIIVIVLVVVYFVTKKKK